MRLPLALCTVFVLFAGVARGDEPKIVGSLKVEPYKIVKLKVTGLADTDAPLWRVKPKEEKNVVDFGLAGMRNGRDLEFTAPPGVYVVELVIVGVPPAAGKPPVLNELVTTVTIGKPPAPPVPPNPPIPPPKPKPPVPPVPPAPAADAELVAKYKAALDKDAKESFPMGGSKEAATKLGDVYLLAAGKLTSTNEADWPKTVGALFETIGGVSVSQKIDRLPYFTNVRAVSSDVLGMYDAATALDSATRAKFAENFKRAGMALKEAAK
jgi:hypothetical protein